MFTGMVTAPPGASGGPLIVTPQDGQEAVGSWGLDNILSTIPSLANSAREVDASWGQLRDLGGSEESPPQPTEKSIDTGPQKEGMSLFGISATALVAGVIAALVIWFLLDGNLAWTLVGGALIAVLAGFVVG